MAEPMINNPAALTTVLMITALNPDVKIKGITGMIAPMAKSKKEVTAAYRAKNKALFASKSQLFLELVLDIDSLLRTREECLTGTWIADARAMGTNDTEKNLFEKNARALITTWDTKKDGSLHDYSHREWAGLTKNLYYERWKLFFSDLQGQLDGKTAKNYNYFSMLDFPWITKFSETHSTQPQGDEIEISAFLYEKYMPLMLGTDKKSFSIPEKQEAGYIAGQLNVANATNYSIQSQSVTDAFSIDNSGKITVNKTEQMLFAVHPVINLRVKAGNSTTPEFVSYTDVTINLYATTAVRNPEKVTEVNRSSLFITSEFCYLQPPNFKYISGGTHGTFRSL